MIDEERYLKFLVKHKLTQGQFLLLFCIYKSNEGTNKPLLELLKQYAETFGVRRSDGRLSILPEEERDHLVSFGFLKKVDDKGTFKSYKVTDKFLKEFIDSYEAITELYAAYPAFAIIKGQRIPIKGGNIHENGKDYWKFIKSSRTLHLQILQSVEYAKEKNMLTMNITNFIHGQYWTTLIAEMESSTSKKINSLFSDDIL